MWQRRRTGKRSLDRAIFRFTDSQKACEFEQSAMIEHGNSQPSKRERGPSLEWCAGICGTETTSCQDTRRFRRSTPSCLVLAQAVCETLNPLSVYRVPTVPSPSDERRHARTAVRRVRPQVDCAQAGESITSTAHTNFTAAH